MSARYLIRIDDVCPTMNWDVWDAVEQLLVDAGINPIVAVVPDNQDDNLCVAPREVDFWSRVRRWQAMGWTIGLHGCTHVYDSRSPGIVGINHLSEFAGVPRAVQRERLLAAHKIFEKERVRPDLWVAPGHSFDQETLALLGEHGPKIISDGLYTHPTMDSCGIVWLPVQMWQFRAMPGGVWTVSHHINRWTSNDINQFAADLRRFRSRISSVSELIEGITYGPPTCFDRAWAALWIHGVRLRQTLHKRKENAIAPTLHPDEAACRRRRREADS